MDSIRISGLELACIVGVRPAERRRRQRVRLTIELELDLARAAISNRISQSVDYSVATDEVAHLLRFRAYRLIETATEEIAAMLLGLHAAVERAHVTLEKPEALRGRASHGSVSITRGRRGTERAPRPFGEEETLLETAEATLALLHVDSGRSLDGIASTPARRLGWLVAGQLGSPPIAQHEPRELARMLKSENHGAERATVFLCSVLGAGE